MTDPLPDTYLALAMHEAGVTRAEDLGAWTFPGLVDLLQPSLGQRGTVAVVDWLDAHGIRLRGAP